LHSRNVSDLLRSRGVNGVGFVKKLWQLNPTFGGPRATDKLWFYFVRMLRADNYVPGMRVNATRLR
jgi:hypothetical protein